MQVLENIQIEGGRDRPILVDLFYQDNAVKKPVVIFAHGFKGFKDWGTFKLVAKTFASKGFVFLKFNFSYNGTTIQDPTEFNDLEAFGHNNFTIELDDLGKVIDWISATPLLPEHQKDLENIYLIGHSRGGAIAILKANEDNRVAKLATWGGVIDFGFGWTPQRLEQWQEAGVVHIENARTKQKMPLYIQLQKDYEENKERLNIREAVKQLKIPFIAIHGTEDESVPFEHSIEMKKLNPAIKLDLIPNGNHTFGGKHPYHEQSLPFDLKIVVEHTIDFFKS